MTKGFSLVLPVWNEESFIKDVVRDIASTLEAHKVNYELLLVENGSVDGSLEKVLDIAKQNPRCKVVVRPKGYGSAVQGGLLTATMDIVGYMPSDGQIEASVLPRLLEIFDSGTYDLVKISRIVRESLSRKWLSTCFNLIAKLLFGVRVKDINGSPKIFLRKNVPTLSLTSIGNLIDMELMAKAKELKWRVLELGTESKQRADGESHVNLKTILMFLRELLELRFKKYANLTN